MADELKALPCPFCGAHVVVTRFPGAIYYVNCPTVMCILYGQHVLSDLWNRRALPVSSPAPVESGKLCNFCGAIQSKAAPAPSNILTTEENCRSAAHSVERLKMYFATRGPLVLMAAEAKLLSDRCREILERLEEGGDNAPTNDQLNAIHNAGLAESAPPSGVPGLSGPEQAKSGPDVENVLFWLGNYSVDEPVRFGDDVVCTVGALHNMLARP